MKIIIAFLALLGVVSSTPYSESDFIRLQTQDLLVSHVQMCYNATGSHEAYEKLKEATRKLTLCIELTVNQVLLDYVRGHLENSYSLNAYRVVGAADMIKGFCNRQTELVDCERKYKQVQVQCLDDNKKKENSKSNLAVLFEYLCYNNGERIDSFFDNDGVKCLKRNRESVRTCKSQVTEDFEKLGVSMNLNEFVLSNQQDCQLATKLANCVVDKLNTCNNKTAANLFKGFFEHFLKHEDCNKYEIK